MPGQVERWLETFMCKQYAETFEAYGFKTLQSLCQLQLPQLQIMGVAQEHCEQILDNVDILRQSLCGNMNHYTEEMYSSYSNRLANMGHMQNNQSMMGVPGSMTGYGSHGYMNNQRSAMMQQQQQQQSYSQNNMYSMPSQNPYLGYAPEPHQYTSNQYTANERRGSMAMGYPSHMANTGYHNGPTPRSHSAHLPQVQQQVQQQMLHPHMRHVNTNQNPQEVANNILQMAASTYMPNQTVTVPLSKNRSAPYHIPPKSPHKYSVQGNGQSPTQHMASSHQFAYPNTSPHHSQGARTSPISPNPTYMHSPASHHSGQSIPNSSPRSIHSPTYGLSGPCVKSPSAVTQSPVGDMRSPCQMPSPVNCGQMAAPVGQQLHVSVTAVSQGYQNPLTSPNQLPTANHYSPKTNPITPPASHNISSYNTVNKPPLHSPHHGDSLSNFFNEGSSNISQPPQNKGNLNNPLQSLQKLCMLPDRQVIDPKSVVNDACLDSPQSCDNSKNLNSDVDSQNLNQDIESASKNDNNSPELGKLQTEVQSQDTETVCDNKNKCKSSSDDSTDTSDQKEIGNDTDCSAVENVTDSKDNLNTEEETDNTERTEADEKFQNETKNGDKTVEEEVEGKEESKGKDDEGIEGNDKEEVKSDEEVKTETTDDVSGSDVIPYQNCGLVQCKNLLSTETSGCEQVICKSTGCKENDEILSEMIDYENATKENNNELVPGLNGDENSCIQYYKPKSINNPKKHFKLKSSLKSLNSNVLSKVSENPISLKTYSRQNQLASKLHWRRTQAPRSRSLRGVPARLANAAQFNSSNYSDSDSDDDGILLVRKDMEFTYDRNSSKSLPFNNYAISDGMTSQDADISSANETEKEDALDNTGIEMPDSAGVQTNESLDLSINTTEVALDNSTTNSESLAIDTSKNQAKVHGKSEQIVQKGEQKGTSNRARRKSSGSKNGHIVSKSTSSVKSDQIESDVIVDHDRKNKTKNSSVDVIEEDSSDENDDIPLKDLEKTARKTVPELTNKTLNKRSSRKRRRTSPTKYGDLYYGADYVMDSEEEIIEIEKKSRKGKEKHVNEETPKTDEPDVIIVNDNDDFAQITTDIKTKMDSKTSENLKKAKPKTETSSSTNDSIRKRKSKPTSKLDNSATENGKNSYLKTKAISMRDGGSRRSKTKVNASLTLKDSNEDNKDNLRTDIRDTSSLCLEKGDEDSKKKVIPLVFEDDENETKSLISISDDEPEAIVKQPKKQSVVKRKKKGLPAARNKSGKGKLKKLQKSRGKFDMFDDEDIEDLHLKRAVDSIKKKHKKREKPEVSDGKLTGPFLRMSKTDPSFCRVINQYNGDPEIGDKKLAKKIVTPVTVSTVHMSKLSSESSVLVPSSALLEETQWVCHLCHKHSSYKFLGDLFGPYYCEGNLPQTKDTDLSLLSATENDSSKPKRKKMFETASGSKSCDASHKSKKHSKSATVSQPPEEIWVHEDCIAWAHGVLLIGPKIYGLEEAASIASATMCSACKENGAMIGCLHKGCSQKFHYICAVESGCFMDEENFSMLCLKHKDKKLKLTESPMCKT